jgi:hypothetical protein
MSSPPTWDQLIVNPELATLHILGGVLTMAQHVLLCAHPELEDANAAPASACPAMAKVADCILTHIGSLEEALQRYPQELQRHHQRLLQEEREIPF